LETAPRVTESADEILFDLPAREEFAIDRLIIEARHWSAPEPDRTRGNDEITTMQAAVGERRRLVDEPRARLRAGRAAVANHRNGYQIRARRDYS
jgi:hypothetical protein